MIGNGKFVPFDRNIGAMWGFTIYDLLFMRSGIFTIYDWRMNPKGVVITQARVITRVYGAGMNMNPEGVARLRIYNLQR